MVEEITLKGCLDYLIDQSKNLLLPYEVFINMYPSFVFDTICDEIALDWDNKYYIDRLFDNKIIDETIKRLYYQIDNVFLMASNNMPNYHELIWKTESLKSHPFWIEQRTRIKNLLLLLENIRL